MILSDSAILKGIEDGSIVIDPFKREHLNPNSVDLTLDDAIKMYVLNPNEDYLDPKKANEVTEFKISESGKVLYPGWLYLAVCKEKIGVGTGVCAQVAAKSSLGRLGMDIIVGPAGFVDTGFIGSLVLEIRVTHPVIVYPGMKICQLLFYKVEGDVLEPYGEKKGSKYQNQVGPQESLYFKNY